MIKIRIYNYNLSERLTTLTQESYSNLKVSNKKMAIGNATFDVDVYDKKINALNLQKYNRVKIYDNNTLVFNGYISAFRISGGASNVVNVVCTHIFGLFEKRLTGSNDNLTGNAGDRILDYLAATNASDDTGIDAGTNSISATATLQFKHQTIFKAWLDLARAAAVEFEIDENDQLNIKSSLGSDKSSTIVLRYNERQPNTTNMIGFDLLSEGKDMANYIIGQAGGSTSTQQDATSQDTFGLLQEVETFTINSGSAGSLAALTQRHLTDNKYSKELPTIEIDTTKIGAYAVQPGDRIKVKVVKGQLVNLDINYVVNEVNIDFVNDKEKKVKLVVADEGTYNKNPNFADDFKKLKDRVSAIERT